MDGFAVNPDTGEVFMQPYKYFMNLIEMPIVLAVLLSYVSILVPFVLAYIFYAWRALDLHKINSKEMQEGGHTY